ncbi:hypothetical protein SmJEL517_g04985 [Synchytrium microbalum]|uniref:F-box domain-containing protein n=1 Tax=Synchytrium microbalum TaxID=1806994 RepID=A0A507C157_9FUNG|nr:uncharacterized protein SmJEL517_g04985 [Synchytrium microbalum]TPX31794.1 hypothetical protein SmJEL517_g04985 [Synchytrium microbalum]
MTTQNGSTASSPFRISNNHRRSTSQSSQESTSSSVIRSPSVPIGQFARVSLTTASTSSSSTGLLDSPLPFSPTQPSNVFSSFSLTEPSVDENVDEPLTASTLPTELLLAIFQHLPADAPLGSRNRVTTSTLLSASLVCKRWFGPATSALWARVSTMADDWESKVKPLVSRVNRLLKDYRKDIRSLEVRATSTAWATGELKLGAIRRALGGCLALRRIEIDVPCLKDDDLWALGASCPVLDYISIVSGTSDSSRITDFGMEGLAAACTRLRHFKFRARGPGVSDRGLSRLAEAFKGRLVTFSLQWDGNNQATHFPTAEPTPTTGDSLSFIIEANPSLVYLSLDWPWGVERALTVVASKCCRLKQFRIGNARQSDTLMAILAANPSLNELGFFEPANITNATTLLSPLWGGDGSVDTEWIEGAMMNTTLTELDLDGVAFIRLLLPALTRLRGLEVLKMSPSRRSAFLNFSTTDEVVARAVRSLGSSLTVIRTPVHGDMPINSIAESCPNLIELDLIDAREMTDKSIILLSKRCPLISRLYLGAAVHLTDASLTILARSLPNLTRLALPFGNCNMTARTLTAVAESCPLVESLSNVPWSLGTEVLLDVLGRMPRLSILGICVAQRRGAATSFPSREDQDLLKSKCRKIRQIILNG